MRTKILGTGLTGLVGSRLVELFKDQYDFANIDLTTGVDITNPQAVIDFITNNPAQVLIHFAAFTNVDAAYDQTDDQEGLCYKVNVVGTQNIVDACKAHDIYLIHVSTDFVFSGSKKEPYTEADPRDPIEWYGKTKAMAEEIVEKSLKHYSIVRLGYPIRANYDTKPGVLTKTLEGLKNNSLKPQFSDMIITPTYVDDFSRAIDTIISSQPTGIFHLHGSSSLSPFELSQKIADVFGYDPNVVKKGSLVKHLETTDRPYQKTLRIDNSKALRELGVELKDIDAILQNVKSQLS